MRQVRFDAVISSNVDSNNSIMDDLRLSHGRLVSKWTSTDPDTKCSEAEAYINIEKMISGVAVVLAQ